MLDKNGCKIYNIYDIIIYGGIMLKNKKALILCIFMFCCYGLFGQSSQSSISEPNQSPTAHYRLFRTTNIWTFLKLDTVTGRIWMLSFDVGGDNRGIVTLNTVNFAEGKEQISGRFTLYPTTNMYNFILIDQIDGNTWQVQWSPNRSNRIVIPIE